MNVPSHLPPPRFPGAPVSNAMLSQKAFAANEVEAALRKLEWALKTFREAERETRVYQDIALNNRVLAARIAALSAMAESISDGEIAQVRNAPAPPKKAPQTTSEPENHDSETSVETYPQVRPASTVSKAIPEPEQSIPMAPLKKKSILALTSTLRPGIHEITSEILVSRVDINHSSPWPMGIPNYALATPVVIKPAVATPPGELPIQITQRNGSRAEYEDRDFSIIDDRWRKVEGIPAPPPPPRGLRGPPLANGPSKGILNPIRRFFPLQKRISSGLSSMFTSTNAGTTPAASLFWLFKNTNSTVYESSSNGAFRSGAENRAYDRFNNIIVDSGPKGHHGADPVHSSCYLFTVFAHLAANEHQFER